MVDTWGARQLDFWETTLPVIVGGIIAGLFAITGSYFATSFQMKAQSHADEAAAQRKVFAELMGRKLVTEQLNVSRAEALIISDYNEELWRRSGPKDSLDLEDAQRWMHRSEDLVFEIMKNNQALFEDVATVQALFPDTPDLRALCEPVYKFRTLVINTPVPHDGSIDNVTQWKDHAEVQTQALAESEYGKPIDDLSTFLRTQLLRTQLENKTRNMDHAWISLVAAVGAFAVSIVSIILGYRLFLDGATGKFKFEATMSGGSVGFESVAPGLAFAFFGAFIAVWAVYRLLPH
jgi:hypothetical protein